MDILSKYGFRLVNWRGRLSVAYGNGVKFRFDGPNRRGPCFGGGEFTCADLVQADADLTQIEASGQDATVTALLWELIERYNLQTADGELGGDHAVGMDRQVIITARDRIITMLGGDPLPRAYIKRVKHRSTEQADGMAALMAKYKPCLRYEEEEESSVDLGGVKQKKVYIPGSGRVIIKYTYLGERIKSDIAKGNTRGSEKHRREIAEMMELIEAEPEIKNILLQEIITEHNIKLSDGDIVFIGSGYQRNNIIKTCKPEIIKMLRKPPV